MRYVHSGRRATSCAGDREIDDDNGVDFTISLLASSRHNHRPSDVYFAEEALCDDNRQRARRSCRACAGACGAVNGPARALSSGAVAQSIGGVAKSHAMSSQAGKWRNHHRRRGLRFALARSAQAHRLCQKEMRVCGGAIGRASRRPSKTSAENCRDKCCPRPWRHFAAQAPAGNSGRGEARPATA